MCCDALVQKYLKAETLKARIRLTLRARKEMLFRSVIMQSDW